MSESVAERFLRYVKICTTSDPGSSSIPSTSDQMDFALLLSEELKSIGLDDASVDHNGYVTASLPGNSIFNAPVIGFIAHMDTSPDFNGNNILPQIHQNYNGDPIRLKNQIIIDPAEFPELNQYLGSDIITTDGTSLLGADDKAGISEIITAIEKLIASPEIKHGKIKICFTPDEEIGKGADHFDIEGFGADFAFTMDGGELGELEFENFNAALVNVAISGRSVHPGSAKNKMINASLVGHAFISMLPSGERPEHTENYEGFYHLVKFIGNVEKAELQFLIRDHNSVDFENRKKTVREITSLLNLKFGEGIVKSEIRDQYFNMKEKIEPVMYIIRLAEMAMLKAGIVPKIKPVRGGTDGARLSWGGLPCPNIFTGGHNFHGPYEFIPVNSMEKAVEVIVNICELVSELKK